MNPRMAPWHCWPISANADQLLDGLRHGVVSGITRATAAHRATVIFRRHLCALLLHQGEQR